MSAARNHSPHAHTRPHRGTPMHLITARLAALALASAALGPAIAAEGYVVWDDFNGATAINAGKWLSLERVKQRQNGALRIVQRDRAGQVNTTDMFNSTFGQDLKNPEAITQMRVSIMANAFAIDDCPANTNPEGPPDVQARAFGWFFNAGAGAPGSKIGDVGAGMRYIRRGNSTDGAGVMRVEGYVVRCNTSDCNYGTTLVGLVDLGTVSTGQWLTLKFDWEPGQDRFNFYRGSDAAQRISYSGLSDTSPPYSASKAIATRTRLESCQTGRNEGFIDASFDNISVNASAAP